jgi:hypothetical protein
MPMKEKAKRKEVYRFVGTTLPLPLFKQGKVYCEKDKRSFSSLLAMALEKFLNSDK